MIADLKPYPAMKDSGVETLAQVPGHWEIRQLGRIGRFSKGSGGTKEDEVEGGVPCMRYGDLYNQYRFFIERTRSSVSLEKSESYTPIYHGDVLFAGSGETIEEIGKSAVNLITEPACAGGDVIIFRPSIAVDAKFLGLATDCPQAVHQKSCMGRGITIMHIYGDELKYLSVALPPLTEQDAIVRYLGHVDRRVRRLVRAKRKLIALLTEQKQAMIHNAVTRGLDPDVPLKDSGVEWLGEVPEHWSIVPSKALFKHRKEKACQDDEQLTASQNHGIIAQAQFMALEGRRVMSVFIGRDILKHVEPNDFVISMRSFQGGIEWSRVRGAISSAYVMLIPTEGVHPPFFAYLLKSRGYIAALRQTSDLVRDGQALRYANFAQVPLPLVPQSEQRAVAELLDGATTKFTAAINLAHREIGLLEEYRTRLTADVVTGKLDVREAAAGLPEVDPLDAEEDLAELLNPDAEMAFDDANATPEVADG